MSGLLILVLGVLLWSAAHLFKRLAPAQRETLARGMGEGAKGVFALLILAGVVLMVLGWKWSDTILLWVAPAWMGHLNNLLMLISFYVFGIGMAKGALSQRFRHPMLTGVLIWAVAHLLVNGDVAGVILFGGLGLWAVLSIVLINAQSPGWTPPQRKPGPRDAVAVLVVLVVYAVVGLIHAWLGYNPFGSL